MSDTAESLKIILTSTAIAGIIMFVFASGNCELGNKEASKDLLERQGYTDVEMTGYAPFACGEGDYSSDGFVAKSPNGSKVTGAVCCGGLKGCTIRFR